MTGTTRLFDRAYRVVINELEITGLDITFHVQRGFKPGKPEPDTLELQVFNLNEDHRGQLQKQAVVPVRLEAGYATPKPPPLSASASAALDDIGVSAGPKQTLPLLFLGELREVSSSRQGPDWVTSISSGDGDSAKKKRISRSFGPGATLAFALEQVAKELGVGLGKLPTEAHTMKLLNRGRVFASGVVLTGNAFEQLTRMLDAAGYEWAIQQGRIVIAKLGEPIAGSQAVLLNSETGLVGSPTPTSDNRVRAQALLQPDLVPGRQVKFDARYVKGYYRIESVAYSGDTFGGDWYADLECKSCKAIAAELAAAAQ